MIYDDIGRFFKWLTLTCSLPPAKASEYGTGSSVDLPISVNRAPPDFTKLPARNAIKHVFDHENRRVRLHFLFISFVFFFFLSYVMRTL